MMNDEFTYSTEEPVTTLNVFMFVGGCLLLMLTLLIDDDGFIFILDHVNLAFHEAGHVVFGILGNTFGLYGGTLGQLVFPVVVIVKFYREQQIIPFAVGLVWLFENFFNIARYMADARTQILPLVGGGEHDWTNIFSRWGALNSDTSIAGFVNFLGWSGILLTMGFVVYRWKQLR